MLVAEVTDDKSLLPSERKKLQIVNAPKKTAGGAHIKLADKADNCDDLRQNPPQGWTIERVQAYFIWSRQVVRAVVIDTPVAAFLKARLESIFSGSFTYHGQQYPCIPDGELSELLEKYYVSLDQRVFEKMPNCMQSLEDQPLLEGEERCCGPASLPCPKCGNAVNIWFRMREGKSWAFRRCHACDWE